MSSTPTMIELKEVHYRYHNEAFLFNLTLQQGDILALLGASGSGKSTLLSLLAGFIMSESGDVLIQQTSMHNKAPHQRPLAFLFQTHNLFEHLTVAENIGLGVSTNLKLKLEQIKQVKEAAQQVGLEHCLQRLPEQLSGGQRQRVALARCLVQPHDIWLLDEPFSALDPVLREEMLQLVKNLARQRGATVIMVTHHVSDAKHMATHFAFMYQGKIITTDTIDALSAQSQIPQVAQFVRVSEG